MTTQAQTAVMESTAAKFEQANHTLEGMLKRLLAELEVLQTQWVGRGGATFEQVKRAWAADQTALHRALAETATAIRNSGRGYQTTDEAASHRFTSQGARLSLPLE